mgnify:CR=1 FL=1
MRTFTPREHEPRPAILDVIDALGLPDCAPGCTCRGERPGARVACQRVDFDPTWCIAHSDDFPAGAETCEAVR